MKLAATIQAMVTAGCTPDQIAAVTAAYETEKAARVEAKRKAARERQRLWRASHALSRDVTVTDVTAPLPLDKEDPHTPIENSTLSPLFYRDPDGSLVDEAVDAPVPIKKPKKDVEALRVFGEEWNQLASVLKLPAIDEIKPGSRRERHALARLREMPANGVQDLMARIRGSPYLRGEVNGFRATFDWIIGADNYQKILDGNYEDRKVVTPFRR